MNNRNKKPLDYGKEACDALMHSYAPQDLPPKGAFFYHQGVFLSGMQKIYNMTGEKRYFDYIKNYMDSVIDDNGEIKEDYYKTTWFKRYTENTMLDFKQPVIVLHDLFDETGDERYIKVIKKMGESMHYWPMNPHGAYWHMMKTPNQVWMDGAYMAGPLSVMYAKRFGDTVLRERAIEQVFIMNDYMKDKKTGLYYHGWDDSVVKEAWADEKTGLSSQFWGRAVGWYAVAILDILDYIPEVHPAVPRLKQIEKELLESLSHFQDEKTGLWFQVLDQIERDDNWVESSCTNLFIYAYAGSIRKGIIDEKYSTVLEKAYKGIEDILYYENGYLVIDKVCVGTGIDEGTYEHYINRQTIKNDLHGAGAFTLMCSEMQKYLDWKENR